MVLMRKETPVCIVWIMFSLVVTRCRIIQSFPTTTLRGTRSICTTSIIFQPYSTLLCDSISATRQYSTSHTVTTSMDDNQLSQQKKKQQKQQQKQRREQKKQQQKLQQQQQLVQDALYRIRQVNSVPPDIRKSLLEFRVDNIALGAVRPKIADLLCSYKILGKTNRPAFIIKSDSDKSFLTLSDDCGTTFDSRSEAVASITQQMKDQGYITGWRDELFPVKTSFYSDPVFSMERAAVSYLGVPEYGVHIIGLVSPVNVKSSRHLGALKMWMARRSPNKSKWPNMMDHIVAGGQPVGLSLMDNVAKECYEEAGLQVFPRLGLHPRPAGVVTYENYVPDKDVVVRFLNKMSFNSFFFHFPLTYVLIIQCR
jgi:hypothetical protein